MRTGRIFAKPTLRDGTTVVLRAPRPSDLDEMLRFANCLVREKRMNPGLGILMDRRLNRKAEAKFLDGLLTGVRTKDAVSVTAEVDGRIVGHTEVRRQPPGDVRHVGRFGIAILQEYRGKGLGKLLMGTVLEQAGALGMKLITLEAYANNEAALQLYRSFGFKEFGRLGGGVRPGGEPLGLVYMFRQS